MRPAARFNLRDMFFQSLGNLMVLPRREFVPKFVQREMDDVVVVDLLGRKLRAEVEPETVKQVDLRGCHARCVRPKVDIPPPAHRA